MKITILNGDPNLKSSLFSETIHSLSSQLGNDHQVKCFDLAQMDLHYCTGCWSCWWKTPGECAIKDDAEQILRAVINSDLIIFASPLVAGFTSARLKKITDRFVTLLHPYIELIEGECHHKKRYEKYPNFGLILEKEIDTDEEDLQIVTDIYDRLALNFHCKRLFTWFVDEIEEIDLKTDLIRNSLTEK